MKIRPLILISLCPLLSACVTESATPRGTPVRADTRVTPAGATPPLPAGPIATPAAQAKTTISRVALSVVHLGTVEYDGQSLPLVSPDGKLLVASSGAAPEWESILAVPGSPVPSGGRINALTLSRTGLKQVEWPDPLPSGAILGRACNDEGFLIEMPREDGSRWIGMVSWATGQTTWLVQGESWNAHGILTPQGELVFTRLDSASQRWVLVLRTRAGAEFLKRGDDGDMFAPVPSASSDVVYCLRSSARGTDIEAFRLRRTSGSPTGFGSSLGRHNLTSSQTQAGAYQLATSVVAPLAAPGEATPMPVAILSTRHNAVMVFDLDSNVLVPLVPRSITATPFMLQTGQGYFCSTDREMFFVPWDRERKAEARSDARVLSSPYVVRPVRPITQGPAANLPRFILLGPVRNQPDRIEVIETVPLAQ